MRTIQFLFSCALLLSGLASCGQSRELSATGELSVCLSAGADADTKGADITQRACEKAIRSVQVFLFKGGTRQDYVSLQGSTLVFPYTWRYASLAAGTYAVYAVANGPDLRSVTTEAQLQSTAVSLSDCGLTVGSGFVMAGSVQRLVVVSGESQAVSLTLERFAARVRVASITNQVPSTYAEGGAVTIKGIFLENAPTRWNLLGTGEPSEWANLGGRVDGRPSSTTAADYITAATQVPEAFRDQLFQSGTGFLARGATVRPDSCFLYAFPNAKSVDHTGATATQQNGALSRVVVLARVNGADWWYPLTLWQQGEGLERNTSYDVALTLRATGSSDPNEPVTAAQLAATITTANGWSAGANYTEPL